MHEKNVQSEQNQRADNLETAQRDTGNQWTVSLGGWYDNFFFRLETHQTFSRPSQA